MSSLGEERETRWGAGGTSSRHKEVAGQGIWSLVWEEPENPLAQERRGGARTGPGRPDCEGHAGMGKLWVEKIEEENQTLERDERQRSRREGTWGKKGKEVIIGQIGRGYPPATNVMFPQDWQQHCQ